MSFLLNKNKLPPDIVFFFSFLPVVVVVGVYAVGVVYVVAAELRDTLLLVVAWRFVVTNEKRSYKSF